MTRKRRTYTIVSYATPTKETIDVPVVTFEENIGAEELPARLANKPDDLTYHVFSGSEIKWSCRQVIEIGAPRVRRSRSKPAEKDKKQKKPPAAEATS
jgi:hypothetical protein